MAVSCLFFFSAISSWPIFPVQIRILAAFCVSLSGITVWNFPLDRSLSGQDATGFRNMLFGVKTTSGLRQLRRAWRRSRWKYWAALEGWQIWMLSRAASWR